MSRGVNKWIGVGNLGKDPEIKHTASGSAIANITLATTDTWMDKQSGEKQERTEWHKIVFFNRLAEIVGEYLRKGSQVYIEGKLKTRKWTDKEGIERWTTEIVANEMQMLGTRTDNAGNAPSAQPGSQTGRDKTFNENNPRPSSPPAPPSPPAQDFDEDTIPF